MRLGRVARIVLVAVAGLVVSAPTSAGAGAPTDQLKASVEQILKVLEDPALKAEARAKDSDVTGRISPRRIARSSPGSSPT